MSNVEEAAKSLYKAMKGFGTDESRLIREIVSHTNGTRQLIKQQYVTMYGKVNINNKLFLAIIIIIMIIIKKLEDDIKSEISGHFLDGVLALLEPFDEYEAKCMSMKLAKKNSSALKSQFLLGKLNKKFLI